jgi:RNA recognition motif-containing protein
LRIYVGNLSYQTTDEHLEAAFSAFGAVGSASVVRDRHTGESRGFGFVEMDNDEEAAAAIAGLNGTPIEDRTVTVNEARPRTGGGGGGGRGRGRGESGDRGRDW